ncbi:MAG: hypothetical protein H6977_09115 [Gammaproteobacteria bacterium]|nr:hypothetical protein [Gammaproteobacteria bacterium]MCP5200163.1 hypothetical protein [Gammaproteobacteria bacterium]
MTRILTALLAVLYLGNGLAMLSAPAAWYAAVPGVAASGPYNDHFVRDIGLAYLLAGGAFAWALRRPRHLAACAIVGSAWPALHALVHLAEWLHHGLPPARILLADGLGVLAPALLGLALAAWAARTPGIVANPRGETPC